MKISVLKFPYDGSYVQGVAAIEQIIKMRLETPLGDIFYQRNKGSQLQSLSFEPNDTILDALANNYVEEALATVSYLQLIDTESRREKEKIQLTIYWSFMDKIKRSTILTFTDLTINNNGTR